jgi:hypothetical protein
MHAQACMLVVAVAIAGCDDLTDGEVLYVVIAAAQPESPDNGVFVELHARPRENSRVKIEVIGGAIGTTPTDAAMLCLPSLTANTPLRYPLIVRPTETEAILRSAFVEPSIDDCSGDERQAIQVVIRRPAVNPPTDAQEPDSEIDASPVDASQADASLPDGGVDAAP